MTPVDEDAINAMTQAGQEFACKQRCRHYNNEWGLSEEQQQERIAHWHAVESRIATFARLIKQDRKKEDK